MHYFLIVFFSILTIFGGIEAEEYVLKRVDLKIYEQLKIVRGNFLTNHYLLNGIDESGNLLLDISGQYGFDDIGVLYNYETNLLHPIILYPQFGDITTYCLNDLGQVLGDYDSNMFIWTSKDGLIPLQLHGVDFDDRLFSIVMSKKGKIVAVANRKDKSYDIEESCFEDSECMQNFLEMTKNDTNILYWEIDKYGWAHPFRIPELGTYDRVFALAMNDNEEILFGGFTYENENEGILVYKNGEISRRFAHPNTEVFIGDRPLNLTGDVVGTLDIPVHCEMCGHIKKRKRVGFIWNHTSHYQYIHGFLEDSDLYFSAINNHNQVVGHVEEEDSFSQGKAVIWDPETGLQELTPLVRRDQGDMMDDYELTCARDINDKGHILVEGVTKFSDRFVGILIPLSSIISPE